MPSNSTTSQTQGQSSVTSPWAAAQPALMNLLNGLGGFNTGTTSGQQGAVNNLQTAASNLPNFGSMAAPVASTLLSGGNSSMYAPLLSNAFGSVSNTLSRYLSPSYTNPSTNPDLSGLINTTDQDITNQIKGEFAGAGRSMSPAETTALARGLSQGEAGILANQYNTNVGQQQNAAGSLLSGANSTAGQLTNFNQLGLGNMLSGLTAGAAVPGLAMAPAMAQLSAANTAYGLPIQNIGGVESLVNPIASLGGQSTGQSTGTTTQQGSPISNIIGGTLGGLGILGSLGGAGGVGAGLGAVGTGLGSIGSSLGSLAPLLLSDERVKHDIKPVGLLFDSTPVYSYRYVREIDPDQTPRIGVMAQDVEKTTPEAVGHVGGVKVVDYDKATRRSRVIGGLLDGLELAA